MKKNYFSLTALLMVFGLANARQGVTDDDVVSDFENLLLEPNSYWNGSDLSGSFSSGLAVFPNTYDTEWMSWSQWAYSNMADDTTAGFMNQYSAITAAGFDPVGSDGSTYAVAYAPNDFISGEVIPVPLKFLDTAAHIVKGCYVTNSTYAALAMEDGDDFSKKFGGESGEDPDYFKLMVWGVYNGLNTDTVDFFLADYRFADNADDYIVRSWTWVDLEGLGKVDSLMFTMESTDMGMFGMNTPGYFCLDNLTIEPDDTGIFDPLADDIRIQVYPNPSSGSFRLQLQDVDRAAVYVSDLSGKLVYVNENAQASSLIDLGDLPRGCYLLRVQHERSVAARTLMIR
jgi:hypothetical protein